ncbi:septum formation family protein [Micromonospora sp. CPCC 205539]|uniref:septum formation family protein n=1 Tax=Micromonospora sp. CPCC 205539 TaxID=3122408 RepID=UPI002FEFB13F
MRRQTWAAVTAAFIVVALAGCGTPAGTDGDVADDWQPMAQAQQFTPKAGECHVVPEDSGYLTSYAPVDCAKIHLVETFHIGTFTGTNAARTSPPASGSTAMRGAFADCDKQAKQFVGGDWRNARLSLQVTPASPHGWNGGGRWYRCDIFELNEEDGVNNRGDRAMERTGTLRGAAKNGSPLLHGCMTRDKWEFLRAAACTAVHQYEYAGIWNAPDRSFEDATRDEDAIHAKCRTVIARYAKVPVDANLRYRTGSTYVFPSRQLWERGDRGVRCYFYSSGDKIKRSIAGGGSKVLPIN